MSSTGQPAPAATQQPDPAQASQSLVGFASAAEENLVKLATGLAQAGASPQTVSAIHQMADMVREVAQAVSGQGGGPGHLPGAQPAGSGPPPGQPSVAPAPAPAPQPEPQNHTFGSATQHLHEATMAAAQLRQQGGQPPR